MSRLIEEWRPVVGYEGLYEVSDWGNVKSVDRYVNQRYSGKIYKRRVKGRILKKTLNSDEYHVVCLHDSNGEQHEGKVHRLVAEAFLPNPQNKPYVGHLKTLPNGLEDKTANETWNIAWMTPEENGNYGTLPQRIAEKMIGENNPMYGKDFSQEHRRKMSESRNRYLKSIMKI